MNHPVFLRTLRSQNIFKISDKLNAFKIQDIPNKKITLKQYQCKKTLKTVPTKTTQQSYILTTIHQDSYVFLQLKQTTSQKPSTFMFVEEQFIEKNFLMSLLGQISEISSHEYQISGYRWDGFVIEFIPFSEDLFLFIITNQMISPLLRRQDQKELQIKIRQGFQELLSRIINQKKSGELIQTYLQQIKKLLENHPELSEITEEGEKIVNFNLIKYAKISQISSQEAKNKPDDQKKDKSHHSMEIQK